MLRCYPDRVARIRAARGVPPDVDFGPPEPEIIAALLRTAGISPRVTRPAAAHVRKTVTLRGSAATSPPPTRTQHLNLETAFAMTNWPMA